MKMMQASHSAKAAGLAAAKAQTQAMAEASSDRSPRGYGWRLLPRFKVVNGRRFQLHAMRGWKCLGRVKK